MVDVGGSCGALIVFAPESMLGVEIEIRPVGTAWTGPTRPSVDGSSGTVSPSPGCSGRSPRGVRAAGHRLRRRLHRRDSADLRLAVHAGAVTNGQWPADPGVSAVTSLSET